MAIASGRMDQARLDRAEKGIRLYKLRTNSRWYSHAQEAFAHSIGYKGAKAASNISRIESGERSLPSEKVGMAAYVLSHDPDLVSDQEYLEGFLRLRHADLRGCLAAHPRFSPVDGAHDEPPTDLGQTRRFVGNGQTSQLDPLSDVA